METKDRQGSASAVEKSEEEAPPHSNEDVTAPSQAVADYQHVQNSGFVKKVEDESDNGLVSREKESEGHHMTKPSAKVRRTKSMTASKIARSGSIKKSNSIKRTGSINKRGSATFSNQSSVDEEDEKDGPVRKPSTTGELNKYEKSRVRRRSSLGSYEMGGPMFAFQRRELLSSKHQESAQTNDKIEMVRKKKFKVMLLGDSGVGKSTLLTCLTGENLSQCNIPDVIPEPVEIQADNRIFEMWDTSGRKEYDNIRQFTFLRSKVFLTCFSINDRCSLDNVVMKWIPMARNWSSTALVVMICLKIDLKDDADLRAQPNANPGENASNDVLKSFEWKEKAKEMEVACLECTSKSPLDLLLKDLSELVAQHFD